MTIQELAASPLRKAIDLIASGRLVSFGSADAQAIIEVAKSLGHTGCTGRCGRRMYTFLSAKMAELDKEQAVVKENFTTEQSDVKKCLTTEQSVIKQKLTNDQPKLRKTTKNLNK